MKLNAQRIELRLHSIQTQEQRLDAMSDEIKAQLSQSWLEMVQSATEPSPWIHGFETILTSGNKISVGECGFKGPPDEKGMVEIAYHTLPEHEGNGFATEAAATLVDFAFSQPTVKLVRAHTLPEPNASTRILEKCGFEFCGQVIDPDDGAVWRWEKQPPANEA